jgi:hypothetical protein
MMEPDVREETNRLGFCNRHFLDLQESGDRLSLALMLNSHLQEVRDGIFGKKGVIDFLKANRRTEKASKSAETCFVCAKTDWGMNHMAKSFFVMYRDDPKFKPMFNAQEFICIPHYSWIRGISPQIFRKGELSEFLNALDQLVGGYAARLNSDVGEFCDSFDYRNAGKLHSPEKEHIRSSVSRAVNFLTGRKD